MFRSGLKGAALCALVGLVFLILLGKGLTFLSYDLPFLFRANIPVDEVVLLYMDDQSEQRLQQPSFERWNRNLHAELLRKLANPTIRPKAVVFDLLFDTNRADEVAQQAANSNLVAAAKTFGSNKVVVAAQATEIKDSRGRRLGPGAPEMPYPALAATVPVGLAEVIDADLAVREHYHDAFYQNFQLATLAWRAAEAAQGKLPGDPLAARWINYYGPPEWLRHFSYADAYQATNLESWQVLSNKLLFIGAQRRVPYTKGIPDQYRTPYTRWGKALSPGVEITATATLNLMRQDWLKRLPPVLECLVIVVMGAGLGVGLARCRPTAAAGWAVGAALVVSAGGTAGVWLTHYWFPWMIVVAAQVPCALAWSVLANTKWLLREKTVLEQKLALATAGGVSHLPPGAADLGLLRAQAAAVPRSKDGRMTPAKAGTDQSAVTVLDSTPTVPDHELLCRIGQGAYGEVWLARDILGIYHAAKIVYRKNFPEAAPYDREFRGLRHFTPISRAHPGLVNILHVGRNTAPEYFYYVMEAGDDETTGAVIDPKAYSPRNLAKDLKKRKRLPLAECLQLGIDLAAAVEFLHQQHLIHRDIKPSNIIFVKGVPKLADVGLVTDIPTLGGNVSYVGTQGYLPPEGPGTPAADVYSLGKVIYETALGLPCTSFPELPGTLFDQVTGPGLLELNQIILKACENNCTKRLQSAAELQTALAGLLERIRGTPEESPTAQSVGQSGKPKGSG